MTQTATKERPILFSGPMVRAILEGRKTQTRRVVKPQPDGPCQTRFDESTCVFSHWDHEYPDDGARVRCPYGAPGDRLWCVQMRKIGYGDGKYAVGDDGNVYDISGPIPVRRKTRLSHNGYKEITLRHSGKQKAFRINRLVAEAFYGPAQNKEVCRHLNGIRTDNRPENLDWGTPKQNSADANATGAFSGPKASQSKLTPSEVDAIRESDLPQAEIAEQYGITQPTVSKIRSGKRWRNEHPSPPPRNRPIDFSRITLEVKRVWVEQINQITPSDIEAEGIASYLESIGHTEEIELFDAMRMLWDSINGKKHPWASNPWVWCVEFERVER